MNEQNRVGQDYIRGEVGGGGTTGVGKYIDQNTVNIGIQDKDLTRADLYHGLQRLTEQIYLLSGDMRVVREQLAIVRWLRLQVIVLGVAIIVLSFAFMVAWFGMDGQLRDVERQLEYLLRNWTP